jgi:hypothetical protein
MRSEESKFEDPQERQPSGADSAASSPQSSFFTPHRIRLGPPWQTSATDSGTRHARKFGRPRTLDANERLWLVCDHVPGPAEVHLNGSLAGTAEAGEPFAADITSLLQPRNEVVFAVAADGALGNVALEVRAL